MKRGFFGSCKKIPAKVQLGRADRTGKAGKHKVKQYKNQALEHQRIRGARQGEPGQKRICEIGCPDRRN